MNTQPTWLTAADAAKILKCSVRQVHRYGELGQLVTRRAGRRVLFSAESVATLADDLAVDYRPPPPPPRDLAPMIGAIEQLQQRDQRITEGQERIEQRLQRIEDRPALPRWAWALLIAVTVISLLTFIGLLLILTR